MTALKRGSLRPYIGSFLVLIVGIALFVLILTGGIRGAITSLERIDSPGSKELQLRAGKYTIFWEHPTVTKEETNTGLPIWAQENCTITWLKTGEMLPLKKRQTNSFYAWGDYRGKAILEFQTAEAGQYLVTFSSQEIPQGNFAIGKNFNLRFAYVMFGAIMALLLTVCAAVILVLRQLNRTIHGFLDDLE